MLNNYVVQCVVSAAVLGIYEAESEIEAYKLMLEEAEAEDQNPASIPSDIKVELVVTKKIGDIYPAHVFVYNLEGEGFWCDDSTIDIEEDSDSDVYLPDELYENYPWIWKLDEIKDYVKDFNLKSHTIEEVIEGIKKNLPVFVVDTDTSGNDDIVIMEKNETEKDVKELFVSHFELEEWPDTWSVENIYDIVHFENFNGPLSSW